MAKKNNTNTYLVIGIIGLLLVAGYFGGLFSIAVGVGPSNEGKYSTPSQALAVCEQERAKAQAGGQTCDPCGIACPSSARDGTYDWNNDGITDASFSPSICSTQYTALGNLLEAQSFCHDTIRLCQVQSGTGSVIGNVQVKNGQVNTIQYSYYLTNCATGKYYGASTLTSTVYQLSCNQGYIVDGTRQSSSQGLLGTCVLPITTQPQPGTPQKTAKLSSVVISSPAESGKSLRITGVVDVSGADGNYYINGKLDTPPTNTFSVLTGLGFQDECGNDPLAATLIKSAKVGDQVVFALDIPAPNVASGSSVQSGYKVEVLTGCGGTVLDSKSGTYTLVPKPVPTTTPIIVPVNNATAPDPTAVQQEQLAQQGTACQPGDTASVAGCIVAQCSANTMQAIDPIICANGNQTSGSTTNDLTGAVTGTNDTPSVSWWTKFVDWLKHFFRIA